MSADEQRPASDRIDEPRMILQRTRRRIRAARSATARAILAQRRRTVPHSFQAAGAALFTAIFTLPLFVTALRYIDAHQLPCAATDGRLRLVAALALVTDIAIGAAAWYRRRRTGRQLPWLGRIRS